MQRIISSFVTVDRQLLTLTLIRAGSNHLTITDLNPNLTFNINI